MLRGRPTTITPIFSLRDDFHDARQHGLVAAALGGATRIVSRGWASIPRRVRHGDAHARLAQIDPHGARGGGRHGGAGDLTATPAATLAVSCLMRSASWRLQMSVASAVCTTIRSLTPSSVIAPGRSLKTMFSRASRVVSSQLAAFSCSSLGRYPATAIQLPTSSQSKPASSTSTRAAFSMMA